MDEKTDLNNNMQNEEPQKKVKKPIFKKWWFWVIIVLAAIIIISAAGGKKNGNSNPTNDTTNNAIGEPSLNNNGQESKDKEAYEIGDGLINTWKNSIGDVWVSVAIPVKNTGSTNLYLSSGTIDIENADGALIKTLSLVSVYPQVLQPGETAYYFDEATLDEEVENSELKAIAHTNITKAQVDCIRLDVTEAEVKETDYFGAEVTGRVENTTDEPQSSVYIIANLYDGNGNLIVQQMTILDNDLQPGEKIGFKTSNLGLDVSSADVANFEVFAFPYQYQF